MKPHLPDLKPVHVAIFAPLGLLIALVSTAIFTCSCGWLQPRGLPLVLAGAALSVWTLLRVPARPYAPGFLAMLCTVLTSVLLANGLADVLLFNGHGAWLNVAPRHFAVIILVIGTGMLVLLTLMRPATAAEASEVERVHQEALAALSQPAEDDGKSKQE